MLNRLSKLPKAMSQTLLYGVSVALMKGVSLLMLPIVTHYLEPEAFGRLEVLSSLAVIGSILVAMGLEDTLYRFAGQAKDDEERHRHAAQIFGLTLMIGASAWAIGWLAAPIIAAWMPGGISTYEVRLVLSLLALEGCISIPLGWLRMRDRAVAFFIASTGRALLQALLVVLFLHNGGGVEAVLEAGLIAALIQTLYLGYLHIREVGLHFCRSSYPTLIRYSLPIVFSGLVAFALTGLDRWILADQVDMVSVAQYGVAAKFALAVVLLLQPFGMWWSPRRFQVLDGPNGHAESARIASLGVTLTLMITLLVGLLSPLMIGWMMPDEYRVAGHYVAGLALAMAFKEAAELLNIGCFIGKTTRAQLLINIAGTLVGVAAMLLLVSPLGVWGVVIALVAAQGVRFALFVAVSQHFLPLPYPAKTLVVMTVMTLLWLLIGSQLQGAWMQIITTIAAIGSLLAVAVHKGLIPMPQRFIRAEVEVECA